MSTPVSPLATVERDIIWIRAHATVAILAVALIAGSIIGGVALFQNMQEKHDARISAQAAANTATIAAQQTVLLTQLQQAHEENAARDAANTALIQTLVVQMTQQRAATARQIQTDSTLDAQAAAARLVTQTKTTSNDVTVSGDSVTMTLPLTRIVVANLDQLAQAQSDVTNLEGQLGAEKSLASDANVELSAANNVIAADKTELIATIKSDESACQVRIDKQVAATRKHGLWASVASFVAGVVVRGLL